MYLYFGRRQLSRRINLLNLSSDALDHRLCRYSHQCTLGNEEDRRDLNLSDQIIVCADSRGIVFQRW